MQRNIQQSEKACEEYEALGQTLAIHDGRYGTEYQAGNYGTKDRGKDKGA